MNSYRYFSSRLRPNSLHLLREFQCNTLNIAPLRRARHLDTVVLWSPLPKAPSLPLRYVRK